MDPVTRRSFLIKARQAPSVPPVSPPAVSHCRRLRPPTSRNCDPMRPRTFPAVLVDIKDAATGEVEILVGEREVSFTDKALVAKVLRAAR